MMIMISDNDGDEKASDDDDDDDDDDDGGDDDDYNDYDNEDDDDLHAANSATMPRTGQEAKEDTRHTCDTISWSVLGIFPQRV